MPGTFFLSHYSSRCIQGFYIIWFQIVHVVRWCGHFDMAKRLWCIHFTYVLHGFVHFYVQTMDMTYFLMLGDVRECGFFEIRGTAISRNPECKPMFMLNPPSL